MAAALRYISSQRLTGSSDDEEEDRREAPTLKQWFYSWTSKVDSTSHKTVRLNPRKTNQNASSQLPKNAIYTTKYNILTFLPKFFLEQFGRIYNLFFLFTAAVALVPQAAIIDPAVAVTPIVVILAVSALREIYEDLRRFRADYVSNHQSVFCLINKDFVRINWADVVEGDILRFQESDSVCADVVLLATSDEHSRCYVETSSLDGEANLKPRQCLPPTAHCSSPALLSTLDGELQCEHPNNHLYTFVGLLILESPSSEAIRVAIGPNEIVLRGSRIKNTKTVYAVAVNTGQDTKLFKNSQPTPIKRTELQKQLNRQVFVLFLFEMFIAVAVTVGRIVWDNGLVNEYNPQGLQPWYLPQTEFADIFQFLSGILFIANIIPLAVFVLLEIVRLIQARAIAGDPAMYYAEKDRYARAPSSSLNEELGQISHVFSDKTGTLTQNKLQFHSCVIDGKIYQSDSLIKDVASDSLMHQFLLVLSLCHSVISINNDANEIEYNASSPDDLCLVNAAKGYGFVFKFRYPRSVTMEILGKEVKFELLHQNDFSSERRRMSVIVRTPTNQILLLCKGADSVIFDLLHHDEQQQFARQQTEVQLSQLARDGKRTMCMAVKVLSEEQYNSWTQLYHTANTSLANRSQLVEEAIGLIEQDMSLVGATAIDDQLQDGVPETLVALAQADIRVWVLTGDKQETAINIGYASRLLNNEMNVLVASGDEQWLRNFLDQQSEASYDQKLGLVIDGSTLVHALSPDMNMQFLEFCLRCQSVICCRVSPLQKAKVVKLVKNSKRTKGRTLAIGDGANDISMIQTASIGVGIEGEEGSQAARSADYSIAQFRFLQNLLFVHGTWNYFRQTRLIFYTYYVMLLYHLAQSFNSIMAAWSNVVIYQQLLSGTLYFTLFTAIDIIFPTVLDRVISEKSALAYPQVYASNLTQPRMTMRIFLQWWIIGIVHSIILFVFCYYAFGPINFSVDEYGNVLFTCIFMSIKIVLFLIIIRITVIDFVAIMTIIVTFVILQVALSLSLSTDITFNVFYGMLFLTSSDPIAWLLFLLCPTTLAVSFVAWQYWLITVEPSDYQLLNEMELVEPSAK